MNVTPEIRERLERRRAYLEREMERANGEYYQELKSELFWLDKLLAKEAV